MSKHTSTVTEAMMRFPGSRAERRRKAKEYLKALKLNRTDKGRED